MPSPFERLMQQVSELANKDPNAAFDRLEELYGKSQTDMDVRHLGALAAHIGGAGLGRWHDCADFLKRCLEHPCLEVDGDTQRSLWRALCVIYRCSDQKELATDAFAAGVRNKIDHCRIAIMCAQTMIARNMHSKALPHLQEAGNLVTEVDAGDEVVQQVAAIATNITRHAEATLTRTKKLLLTSSSAARAAWLRMPGWQDHHRATYQEARAQVLAGNPSQALNLVQELMALEEANEAGPLERFYTASIACRAQMVRGQFKIAKAAMKACQQLVTQISDNDKAIEIGQALNQLSEELEAAQATVQHHK